MLIIIAMFQLVHILLFILCFNSYILCCLSHIYFNPYRLCCLSHKLISILTDCAGYHNYLSIFTYFVVDALFQFLHFVLFITHVFQSLHIVLLVTPLLKLVHILFCLSHIGSIPTYFSVYNTFFFNPYIFHCYYHTFVSVATYFVVELLVQSHRHRFYIFAFGSVIQICYCKRALLVPVPVEYYGWFLMV